MTGIAGGRITIGLKIDKAILPDQDGITVDTTAALCRVGIPNAVRQEKFTDIQLLISTLHLIELKFLRKLPIPGKKKRPRDLTTILRFFPLKC